MKVPEPKTLIAVQELTKQFTTYKRVNLLKREKVTTEVVKAINFNIQQGEVVGFLGPNGAGKSTTIKMLSGILTPTSGECYVNQLIPTQHRKENARSIGVVFGQRTQLWWDLSVWDNLRLLKEIYQIKEADFQERYTYLDNILDIEEIKDKQVRTLSLGQRMKADLAGALLHRPKLLFLDEPTIGLDVVIKDRILQALKQINRDEKVTILLTTHDMRDVETLCQRAIIINHGEIIYDDCLTALKAFYGQDKVIKLTLRQLDNVAALIQELKAKQLLIAEELKDSLLYLTIQNDIQIEKEVLLQCFQLLAIEKIEFEEIELEEVIKRIYGN
ncbi:ATP-binding cassette domain-containing protein [Aerococcaceae bacterium NML210727]|nr:ATP-binding cassette domain-containing protein [Aerococcaceae bacterium NML210727]MCW6655181.1 ATP-binding cassette domain-containing protein [Aerococcaceae bacterium NML201296]MCW6661360.1 ATP-binding cassette domain-containing protein [Aerococcaceae bacterium NML201209]MCW6665653.1 ATP-binding cassette domain-containing protein [Aerococcaceae bacterium NML191219]MCW6667233.1 ATP-binding cassette domain-containing protein [Aerococcaceae bacterium NML190938]